MLAQLRHLFTPHHTNNQRPKILHLQSLVILFSLLLIFQSTISFVEYYYPKVLGYASQIPIDRVLELTNQERQKYDLPPLTLNDHLSDAARRKAADMFAQNYWAHNAPDGTKPWKFILAAGYNYLHAGENLARDFTTPENIVAAWMASPTHRDNILNPRYQDIGFAVVDGQLTGGETTLVVQMFGTPQSATAQLGDSTSTLIPQAQAQESPQNITPTPSPQPSTQDEYPIPTPTLFNQDNLDFSILNSLAVSKAISLSFAILIFAVLTIDWIVAWDKNLIRLSGKNWAHLTFIVFVIIAVVLISQGQIL